MIGWSLIKEGNSNEGSLWEFVSENEKFRGFCAFYLSEKSTFGDTYKCWIEIFRFTKFGPQEVYSEGIEQEIEKRFKYKAEDWCKDQKNEVSDKLYLKTDITINNPAPLSPESVEMEQGLQPTVNRIDENGNRISNPRPTGMPRNPSRPRTYKKRRPQYQEEPPYY